ncbi:MAG: hypothetical protein HZC11_00005, partial [Nitrospirae bacterium]|nr:hypothetical protein [Nitrospirota bacterium]
LSLNVTAPTTGSLKYYYSRSRLSLNSTSITGVSASGGVATVTGGGTVNGLAGCTFTAAVTDSPDKMGITIVPGGYCTTSYIAPVSAVIGNYTVVGK